jgi:hypothetical protein
LNGQRRSLSWESSLGAEAFFSCQLSSKNQQNILLQMLHESATVVLMLHFFFFILFFVRKEKYAKETLSCDKNREIPPHRMEFSMERFTSSLWSILCP